jgi:hypothetical protein
MTRGLPGRQLRPFMLTLLILASVAGMVRSAETSVIVYSTDFSSDPNWVTNNPYTNHWDEAMGMYHYALRDSTNTFVYKKVPYTGESFRLEYDLYPSKTDFQSSFRLGLGNRDMSINQGTTIFTEFENGPYGKILWIRAIDQQNQRREASSYSQSYGGPSVRFEDGIPYHVILSYDREKRSAGIAVSFLSNRTTLWGYTLSVVQYLGPMDRILLSTIGDFQNPSAVAEGNIDNVSMRIILSPGEPETPVSTEATTLVTGEVTATGTRTPPVSTPSPTIPATTTTTRGAPLPLILVLSALFGAAVLFLARRN